MLRRCCQSRFSLWVCSGFGEESKHRFKIRGAQNAYGFVFIQRGLKPPQKHGPKLLIREAVQRNGESRERTVFEEQTYPRMYERVETQELRTWRPVSETKSAKPMAKDVVKLCGCK